MDIKGKTVLITGGTAWIGFAIALKFAQSGASVIISYMHNEERAKEVENTLKSHWVNVLVVKANSGKKEDLENLFKEAKKLWNIDILVNNIWSFVWDNDGNGEWEKAFHHVMMGTVHACDLFENQWSKSEKIIINISSISWTNPLLWHKAVRLESYCCFKAAVNMFTQIRANKYAGSIRVCAIAPGNTLTEGWGKADEKLIEARINWTLIHRFVTPEEIAKTALHIVDNDALNGQIIVVDWGAVGKGYEKN